jgi:hypothetical protein
VLVVEVLKVTVVITAAPAAPATGTDAFSLVIDVTNSVVREAYAADAGATEVRTPKPREATATSAMRLKVVFVDICFLSISRSEEFPPVGFG